MSLKFTVRDARGPRRQLAQAASFAKPSVPFANAAAAADEDRAPPQPLHPAARCIALGLLIREAHVSALRHAELRDAAKPTSTTTDKEHQQAVKNEWKPFIRRFHTWLREHKRVADEFATHTPTVEQVDADLNQLSKQLSSLRLFALAEADPRSWSCE